MRTELELAQGLGEGSMPITFCVSTKPEGSGSDRQRAGAGSELAKRADRESDRWLESVAEAQLWLEGCEQVVQS